MVRPGLARAPRRAVALVPGARGRGAGLAAPDPAGFADNVAALYLGQMAAQVSTEDLDRARIVELITSGRSGDIGLTSKEAVL